MKQYFIEEELKSFISGCQTGKPFMGCLSELGTQNQQNLPTLFNRYISIKKSSIKI